MADRQTELLEEILAEQKAIRQEQRETNKRIENLETNLRSEIRSAQEDTIDALTALIYSGYENHEERITALEEEVGIKPRKH